MIESSFWVCIFSTMVMNPIIWAQEDLQPFSGTKEEECLASLLHKPVATPVQKPSIAQDDFPTAPLAAQDSSSLEPFATPDNCLPGHRTMRIAARHIEAGGIGYNKGYTTIEGFFAPIPSRSSYMPFLDVRGHVFNDGRLAANAGIGIRSQWGCRIYGINGYYDYRKTHRQHYNQISLGLESLGAVFDFRINGYLPVGKKKSSPFDTRFDHFSGNRIFLSQKFEFAMKGADAEIGYHFNRAANWDFWLAGGPYYFIGEMGGPTWGGKARIGAKFLQYVTLEFLNSWDNTFHYRPQGQITLTWPFGPKAKKKKAGQCSCLLSSRMVQSVIRQEIIAVNRQHKKTVAINPTTGQPYTVLFVDNTSSSAGTFENPYHSLAQAEAASAPGDIIYVFPGNGTTANMDTGIALQLNQKFWGSSVSHPLTTTLGRVFIPMQSSLTPEITNTMGNAITLASGNDVSGFFIRQAAHNGIDGLNVTDVSISNMTIYGTLPDMGSGNGINIIENNGATNNLSLLNLNIINNAENGIYIETDGASIANIFIGNSNVSLNGTSTFTDNNGIILNATAMSTMTATLQNNSIRTNLNQGVVLDSATNGALHFLLENNIIEGQANNGISGNFSGSSNVEMFLLGNTIKANEGQSVFTFTGASLLNATGNHFDQNNSVGLNITAGQAPFTAMIANNTINQNCSIGLNCSLNGTELITMSLHNNDISSNNNIGFLFDEFGGFGIATNFDFSVLNNTITGNCGPGLSIQSDQINTASLIANGNTISGNGGEAIHVLPGNIIGTLSINANENTIEGNCGSGFDLGINNGNAFISLNNNVVQNNFCGTNAAIQLYANSSVDNIEIICNNNQVMNTFGNLGDTPNGILFLQDGTMGMSSFTAMNNNASYNQGAGIYVHYDINGNGSFADNNISNNTTSFNTTDGIFVQNQTSSLTVNSTIFGNTIHNNSMEGIFISAGREEGSGTTLNVLVEQNTLFNNSGATAPGRDMHVLNTDDATICLEMVGNSSNQTYLLENTVTSFNLAPNGVAGAQAVNIGTIQTVGSITSIPSCPP